MAQSKIGVLNTPDQVIGALTGLAGAALMSLNQGLEFVAFTLWLLSNFGWIYFAVRIKSIWLMVMNLGYLLTTISGLISFY